MHRAPPFSSTPPPPGPSWRCGRDEYLARPWEPPAEHWPGRWGGRDSTGGGTWLAVDPAGLVVTALLNGFPHLPPLGDRPTRGTLPLAPLPADFSGFDAFHLVRQRPPR